MANILIGNLFESQAQTLVNAVNCVGVMGRGIALEFKERYPDMYWEYIGMCRAGRVKLGRPYLYKGATYVLNFPTKDNLGSVSREEDIRSGLEYLIEHYKDWGIKSLAVPALGCGYGQLKWETTGQMLYEYLNKMEIPVELYLPHRALQKQIRARRDIKIWR